MAQCDGEKAFQTNLPAWPGAHPLSSSKQYITLTLLAFTH